MGNLKLALETVYLNELNCLPSELELKSKIIISPEFEQRMKVLFHNQHSAVAGRRVRRLILVAIIAALMASAMSVQAIREPIVNFLLDVYEICTDIIFQNSVTEEREGELFIPDPPEGYVEVSRLEYTSLVEAEYKSTEENGVYYTQYYQESTIMSADTEDANIDVKEIAGYTAFLYSNKGYNSIVWSDGKFAYELTSTCSMDELWKFVEKIMCEN